MRNNRFSNDFPQAHFIKVDVDDVPDVAQELNIRAMPTFVIFKDQKEIANIVGANPHAILVAIRDAVETE